MSNNTSRERFSVDLHHVLGSVVSKRDRAQADGAVAPLLCPGVVPTQVGAMGGVNAIDLLLLALTAHIQA